MAVAVPVTSLFGRHRVLLPVVPVALPSGDATTVVVVVGGGDFLGTALPADGVVGVHRVGTDVDEPRSGRSTVGFGIDSAVESLRVSALSMAVPRRSALSI